MNLITVKNLYSQIHENCNWNLKSGEKHIIVGPSGGGKSTFLKILLNLVKYDSGVILNSKNEKWNPDEENISIQFQKSGLINNLTIGENIAMPLMFRYEISSKMANLIALSYMKNIELSEKDFFKFPSECSGGMEKRAALCRALVLDPTILFLDEPTSGLDLNLTKSYIKLVSKIKNTTILMITHDIQSIENFADRVSLIINKKIYTDSLANLKKHASIEVREFFENHV